MSENLDSGIPDLDRFRYLRDPVAKSRFLLDFLDDRDLIEKYEARLEGGGTKKEQYEIFNDIVYEICHDEVDDYLDKFDDHDDIMENQKYYAELYKDLLEYEEGERWVVAEIDTTSKISYVKCIKGKSRGEMRGLVFNISKIRNSNDTYTLLHRGNQRVYAIAKIIDESSLGEDLYFSVNDLIGIARHILRKYKNRHKW